MNSAVEMGSGAMICNPGLINICSAIQKLIGEEGIYGHMAHVQRQIESHANCEITLPEKTLRHKN
jgi:hypothetical protein